MSATYEGFEEKDIITPDLIGEKIIEYAKKYEGTDKYGAVMLAIEFGYELALKNL